jgi:hypothetical protein
VIGVTAWPSLRNCIILKAKLNDMEVQYPSVAVVSAELTVGGMFVVGANVTAIVSRPNASSVTVMVLDDGAG